MFSGEFIKRIEDRYQPFLKECEKYVTNEKNRTGKTKKEVTNVQLEGSFRKLNID